MICGVRQGTRRVLRGILARSGGHRPRSCVRGTHITLCSFVVVVEGPKAHSLLDWGLAGRRSKRGYEGRVGYVCGLEGIKMIMISTTMGEYLR